MQSSLGPSEQVVPFYLTSLSQLIFSLSSLQLSSASLQNHIFLIFSLSFLQSSSTSFKISLFLNYTFHFFQNIFTMSHFICYPLVCPDFAIDLSPVMNTEAPVPHPLEPMVCCVRVCVFFFTWLEYFMFYFCAEYLRFTNPHSTIGPRKLKRTKFLWIRSYAVSGTHLKAPLLLELKQAKTNQFGNICVCHHFLVF